MDIIINIFGLIVFLILIGWIIDKAMGSPTSIDTNKKRYDKNRKKYIKSISTSNPIKITQYKSIINKANKKFINLYNFEIPFEYKQTEYVIIIANSIIFEESRKNRILPDEFLSLLVELSNNQIVKFIKPMSNDQFDFEYYKFLYIYYNDSRARGIVPISSMINALNNIDDILISMISEFNNIDNIIGIDKVKDLVNTNQLNI